MDTFADRGCADRAPLVGRARELDRLDGLLGCRGEGVGPVAVDVTGEPGIGKTRLMTEFAVRARGRGATVLRGRAGGAEGDGGAPFQAFLDAFADLDREKRTAVPALAELARLVEGASGPDAAAGPRGHGESVRRIGAALGCVPAPGLVLLLDDLHRADPPTVALLDHLLRHPPHAPVLVVTARRERQTPPAVASALARAADSGALARLDLGPLEPDDCAGGLASEVPPEEVPELYAASGGNPLYFRALAHTRHRRGE
ncbi:ATP-binding protein, partial [Streptomyces narbonensis]